MMLEFILLLVNFEFRFYLAHGFTILLFYHQIVFTNLECITFDNLKQVILEQ